MHSRIRTLFHLWNMMIAVSRFGLALLLLTTTTYHNWWSFEFCIVPIKMSVCNTGEDMESKVKVVPIVVVGALGTVTPKAGKWLHIILSYFISSHLLQFLILLPDVAIIWHHYIYHHCYFLVFVTTMIAGWLASIWHPWQWLWHSPDPDHHLSFWCIDFGC